MSESFHQDFSAYCVPIQTLQSARLFSLKLERVDIGNTPRRYVDAILAADDRLVPVPFIFIRSNGLPVLHESHQTLALPVRQWLLQTVQEWVAAKPPSANMEADLFEKDQRLASEVIGAINGDRAFIGLAAYPTVFSEADRYAALSPLVMNRSLVDCNPGFGYGARTLLATASHVTLDEGALNRVGRLLPRLPEAKAPADVAVWLDVDPEHVPETLDRMRGCVAADGTIALTIRGASAKERLQELGGDVAQLSPAAGGPLDEWLGIFREENSRKSYPTAARACTPANVSPRPLRVLFGLRPSAETIFGGDVVQIRETASALRERGHDVVVSTAPSLDARGFDIVHLSNLTVPPETLPQVRSVAAFEGPVVMMPIFTDHSDEATWGMEAMTTVYGTSEDASDLQHKLALVERRGIRVGAFDPPPQRCDMYENYTSSQIEILGLVDFLIANAHSEMNRLYRYLTCDVPYAVAPSAANGSIYGQHARARFVERFGLEDFVLLAGRFEPRKNQLPFFDATRELGLRVLLIGSTRDPGFGQIVRMRRSGRAAYMGNLPEEELAGAFAAARVVAVPSWDEVVSLTSLNAAISEASLVLSRNSYEHEYFRDDAHYCDPGSVRSIKECIRRAWDTHAERVERRAFLAERVKSDFSWQRSVELTEAAYYRVLAFNPRGSVRRARVS